VSCIDPSDPITETLQFLADGPKPAVQLPAAGLDQLRQLSWVVGDTVVELTGIGWYHTGPVKGGLLG
jgi:hypothetical protein